MKVLIDTSKDSKEHLRKVISFLESFLDEERQVSPPQALAPGVSDFLSMMGSAPASDQESFVDEQEEVKKSSEVSDLGLDRVEFF